MSKIAFLGPKYLVSPLSAAGLETFACDSALHGREILSEVVRRKVHNIIFITERLASELKETIETAEEEGINIVPLPDHRGSIGFYKEGLQNLMRKATGAAII